MLINYARDRPRREQLIVPNFLGANLTVKHETITSNLKEYIVPKLKFHFGCLVASHSLKLFSTCAGNQLSSAVSHYRVLT